MSSTLVASSDFAKSNSPSTGWKYSLNSSRLCSSDSLRRLTPLW